MNALQLIAKLTEQVADYPERALLPVKLVSNGELYDVDYVTSDTVEVEPVEGEDLEEPASLAEVIPPATVTCVSIVALQ